MTPSTGHTPGVPATGRGGRRSLPVLAGAVIAAAGLALGTLTAASAQPGHRDCTYCRRPLPSKRPVSRPRTLMTLSTETPR